MKPRVGPQLAGEQRAWPLGTVVQLVHKSAWPGKQVSTEAQLSFLPSGFPPWRGLPSPKAVFTEAPPMGWQCSAKLKPQLWDVFSPGHVLRAAGRVYSQCVPGRALLSFAQDNRAPNAVFLRMQLEPEQASFLLLLADGASEQVLCACSLQTNQPDLPARTAQFPSRE